MSSKSIFICLSLCYIVNEVYGQVASLCRANERFLECGCRKTCRNPAPNCRAMCITGCFCEEGQVNNDNGVCVNLADCPQAASAYKLQTTEPRFDGGKCPQNEEYKFCEPCNRTCENPFPVCPAQCARGCFCKDGLVRDKDGKCVELEQCSNLKHLKLGENYKQPIPSRVNCGPYQVYKKCGTCDKTCSNPNPVCNQACQRGCFCQEGYVKSVHGSCVKQEDCPDGS
ncbi:von Willebrand factor [Bombyx mori]|uniref:von Willebrand factor n=1 Tax=Bombyx mori TaxID=7091 RepID=UPI000640A8D8